MRTTFDFNDPVTAHLEANYPYAWDPIEAAKFAELRKAKIPRVSLAAVKAGSALVDAVLDGQLEADEFASLSAALRSGNELEEQDALR